MTLRVKAVAAEFETSPVSLTVERLICNHQTGVRLPHGAPTKGEGMKDTLFIELSSRDNEGVVFNRTEKNVEDGCITWQEAADVFFYALRGHGYIIRPEEFAAYVTEKMKELSEAEGSSSTPVQLSLPLDEI